MITAESDKPVAQRAEAAGADSGLRRLRREEELPRSSCPSFARGGRRDVLFFTQELSTLLNSGVPLDRALSITSELTDADAVPHHRARHSARR